jgi:hypothetical protein
MINRYLNIIIIKYDLITKKTFNETKKRDIKIVFIPLISNVLIIKSTPMVAPCPPGNTPFKNDIN